MRSLSVAVAITAAACIDRSVDSSVANGSSDGSTTVATGAGTESRGETTATATGATEGGPSLDTGRELDCRNPATQTYAGDIVISPDSMDAIDLLVDVWRIDGKLEIYDTPLTHLDFLICVQEVGKNIALFNNDALLTIDGLDGITVVGDAPPAQQDADPELDGWGNVTIADHDVLYEIGGLRNLHEIPGLLSISRNQGPTSITGFSQLETIGGGVTVKDNPSLCASSIDVALGAFLSGPAAQTTSGNDNGC